jgi:hypothetical protein
VHIAIESAKERKICQKTSILKRIKIQECNILPNKSYFDSLNNKMEIKARNNC